MDGERIDFYHMVTDIDWEVDNVPVVPGLFKAWKNPECFRSHLLLREVRPNWPESVLAGLVAQRVRVAVVADVTAVQIYHFYLLPKSICTRNTECRAEINRSGIFRGSAESEASAEFCRSFCQIKFSSGYTSAEANFSVVRI